MANAVTNAVTDAVTDAVTSAMTVYIIPSEETLISSPKLEGQED
jgi:hypothetical protein